MNICVYGAASDSIDRSFIEAGERLGEEMAKRGHDLIFGGGGGARHHAQTGQSVKP